MTVKEAKKLKVGERICWTADGQRGTVDEVSYAAVKIHWDDDQWALMPFQDKAAPWHQLARDC